MGCLWLPVAAAEGRPRLALDSRCEIWAAFGIWGWAAGCCTRGKYCTGGRGRCRRRAIGKNWCSCCVATIGATSGDGAEGISCSIIGGCCAAAAGDRTGEPPATNGFCPAAASWSCSGCDPEGKHKKKKVKKNDDSAHVNSWCTCGSTHIDLHLSLLKLCFLMTLDNTRMGQQLPESQSLGLVYAGKECQLHALENKHRQLNIQALHGPRPGSGTSGAPCCDAEESVEHGMDGDNGKNFCGGRLRLGLDAKPTEFARV